MRQVSTGVRGRSTSKWVAGIAAGAAAGLASQHAGAAVIYTPVDAGAGTVNATTPTFTVDFDHDGTADANLNYDAAAGLVLHSPTVGKYTASAQYVGTPGAGIVRTLAAGESIDPSASYGLLAGMGYGTIPGYPVPTVYATDGTLNSGTGTGEFTAAAGERYVGVEFYPAGFPGATPLFGWVGFRVDDDSSPADLSATVTGYAYETTGMGLAAGSTVPEPSSLGLLAMGATGLAAYRRRGR